MKTVNRSFPKLSSIVLVIFLCACAAALFCGCDLETDAAAPETKATVAETEAVATAAPTEAAAPTTVPTEAAVPTTEPQAAVPKETATPITITSGLTFRRNEDATLSIKAAPNTAYSIAVYYNSGKSTAKGLEAKTSDGNGNVSWTWKIGGKTAPGTYNVSITGGNTEIKKQFTVVVDE